jgi:hypothetical protein
MHSKLGSELTKVTPYRYRTACEFAKNWGNVPVPRAFSAMFMYCSVPAILKHEHSDVPHPKCA